MALFGMDMASFVSALALAVLIAILFIVRKGGSYDTAGPVSIGGATKAAGPENRQHPRLSINWPVTLVTSIGNLQATMSNISMGGAFIACSEPLPLSEQFTLNIQLKGEADVAVNAEVLWSNSDVSGDVTQNRGMGLRFVHKSDDTRELLNRKIVQLIEKESLPD